MTLPRRFHLNLAATGTACALVLAVPFTAGCKDAVAAMKEKTIGAAEHAVGDKIREVAAEKIMQAGLEKDGNKNVKTDFGKNGNTLSLTDKDGKGLNIQQGDAIAFKEADFGVPFYPGATPDVSKSVKMVTGDTFQYTITMSSDDKFEKVSAYYRDKIKAVTGTRRFAEMAEGTGNIKFMLADEKAGNMIVTSIETPEGGPTAITLFAQGKKAPAK